MKSYLIGIAGIVLGTILGFWGRGRIINKNSGNQVKIAGVIDGDTIVTDNKVKIRLRMADAPELENCGGKESKDFVAKLVEGKMVKLEEMALENSAGHRPMYMVYVGETLVNRELLAAGWARYHSDNTTRTEEMKKANAEAKRLKLGIFGDKCSQTINIDNPNCKIKGNIDPDNSQVRIYQMPGCVQYKTTTVDLDRGEQWFCTEAEAVKAGYVISKRCP